MKLENRIRERVHGCYWDHDHNCASTTLIIAAEVFSVSLEGQVLDSGLGMHGAGGYRAQCGLVEGALMFIGILGAGRDLERSAITELCFGFAESYENKFGSLLCRELRPEGFSPDNPPHLCENLTVQSIQFLMCYLSKEMSLPLG